MNKKFVYQVGNNKKVILRCTANQISRYVGMVEKKQIIWALFFRDMTLHIFIRFFYLPTNAQENCFKNNIKIYIKKAQTYFGLIAIIRERIIQAC
jgi:hypothetical protein